MLALEACLKDCSNSAPAAELLVKGYTALDQKEKLAVLRARWDAPTEGSAA